MLDSDQGPSYNLSKNLLLLPRILKLIEDMVDDSTPLLIKFFFHRRDGILLSIFFIPPPIRREGIMLNIFNKTEKKGKHQANVTVRKLSTK